MGFCGDIVIKGRVTAKCFEFDEGEGLVSRLIDRLGFWLGPPRSSGRGVVV